MKCVAIDDEPHALGVIETYCKRLPWLELAASFSDPIAAIESIKSIKPQLILLDIEMPDLSGIQIAKNLPEGCCVIFTTAHSSFAIEGFNLDAADFLLKPFSFERFLKAAEKARKRISPEMPEKSSMGSLSIKCSYQTIDVPVSEISYIEALDNYAAIHAAGIKHVTQMSLKSLEALLPATVFCRCHKSFIVSKDYISSYNKSQIKIGKAAVPVGRSYTARFSSFMALGQQGWHAV
jgi:two-component system, LytTR family, response regulator LytT